MPFFVLTGRRHGTAEGQNGSSSVRNSTDRQDGTRWVQDGDVIRVVLRAKNDLFRGESSTFWVLLSTIPRISSKMTGKCFKNSTFSVSNDVIYLCSAITYPL